MPTGPLVFRRRIRKFFFIWSWAALQICGTAGAVGLDRPADGGGLPAAELQEGLTGEPPFSLVVYNIENLFDIDGSALFEDYRPERYQSIHLLRKLQNSAAVLQRVRDGAGPDIILFQELEADQTPGETPFDYHDFLKKYADVSLAELLREPVSAAVRDLPAEALLLKALQEAGLGEYHVAVADYRPDPTGRVVAHVNATFSKFPIREIKTHHSPGARGSLEVLHDVSGVPLRTFNNHWKSGASDPESESIRRGNASTLRQRVDEILQEDPQADIVIGGDFNSQHNQNQAYPMLEPTALNSILHSQGDELLIQSPDSTALYNLWYELPEPHRGSDVFRDHWGTLMQIMLTRGLYYQRGIQYVDNSFQVLIHENLNAQAGSRLPIRWAQVGAVGGGFSDHFPIEMRFRIVDRPGDSGYPRLKNPSTGTDSGGSRAVDYAAAKQAAVRSLAELGSDTAICDPQNLGHVFLVQAVVSGERPFRVRLFEQDYNLWAFDVDLRREIYSRFSVGQPVTIYAEVGIHEQRWQLVVRDLSWIEP